MPHAQDLAHLRWPDAAERAWLSEQLRAERLQRRLRAAAARSALTGVRPDEARFAPALETPKSLRQTL